MSTTIKKPGLVTMTDRKQITTVGDELLVLAPAKINLSLLIAGGRADGFHEIETIMAKVNWYDEILIEPGLKAGIEFVCTGPCRAPQGKENIVYKACEMFLNSCGYRTDIKITLTKNIPAGAGLGSASSDAAAALIGLNEFLELTLSKRSLSRLAAQLGSDVAFFLGGPLAFCTGKGEKIKKLNKNFNFLALLILPDVTVSTKKVYANYKHNLALYEKHKRQIDGALQKKRIDLVAKMCTNMLEISCFSLYEELAVLKAKVESLGVGPLCLSGSGSTMFCIFESTQQERAEECKRKLEEKLDCKSIIVRNNRW